MKNTLIVYISFLFFYKSDFSFFSFLVPLPTALFLYFICLFRGSFNVRLLKLRIVQVRFQLICPHLFIRFSPSIIFMYRSTHTSLILPSDEYFLLVFYWCLLVSLSSIMLLIIISADKKKDTRIEEEITMLNYSNRCMQVLLITTIHRPRYK